MLKVFPSGPGRDTNGKISETRLGIRKDIWKQFYAPYSNFQQFTIWPIILRPKSRGWIRLKSSNAMDAPLINPNYFSETMDLVLLIDAMKEAYRIASSNPLKYINARPFITLVPGCEFYGQQNNSLEEKEENEPIFSELYLQCVARSLTTSVGDYVGTCRMGPENDSKSVVNPKLEVIGVKGLRVIDASVIPEIPSANINAIAVMIGERGAQLIKNYYHNKAKESQSF